MSEAALISRNQLYDVSESLGCGAGNTDTPWGVPQALSEAVLAGQGAEAHGTIDDVSDAAFALVSSQSSLCIEHVNTAIMGERKYYPGLYVGRKITPLLVNYHHGSSEGDYKIFYQNTVEKAGSFLCLGAFVENIRGNRTFYNEDISWAGEPGRYWETVQNPLKIERYWYLFGGDETPVAIERAIRRQGFTFSAKTRDTFKRIDIEQELSKRGVRQWPPTATQS